MHHFPLTGPVIHSALIPCPRSAYIFQPSMALVLLTFDLSVRQSDTVCPLPPVSVCPCGPCLCGKLKMPERVNCNILQPSNLARRDSFLTCEKRPSATGRGRKHVLARQGRVNESVDASFAVNVSRKWHSAKNAVSGIFDVYNWLDEIPLGFFIDLWA